MLHLVVAVLLHEWVSGQPSARLELSDGPPHHALYPRWLRRRRGGPVHRDDRGLRDASTAATGRFDAAAPAHDPRAHAAVCIADGGTAVRCNAERAGARSEHPEAPDPGDRSAAGAKAARPATASAQATNAATAADSSTARRARRNAGAADPRRSESRSARRCAAESCNPAGSLVRDPAAPCDPAGDRAASLAGSVVRGTAADAEAGPARFYRRARAGGPSIRSSTRGPSSVSWSVCW